MNLDPFLCKSGPFNSEMDEENISRLFITINLIKSVFFVVNVSKKTDAEQLLFSNLFTLLQNCNIIADDVTVFNRMLVSLRN